MKRGKKERMLLKSKFMDECKARILRGESCKECPCNESRLCMTENAFYSTPIQTIRNEVSAFINHEDGYDFTSCGAAIHAGHRIAVKAYDRDTKELIGEYDSVVDASEDLGVSSAIISRGYGKDYIFELIRGEKYYE